MWQEETFDAKTIDIELGYAQYLGFNIIRVFLHHLVWQQNTDGFKQRLDTFLKIANNHEIKTMFVLFDDCWNPEAHLGLFYFNFKKSV
jgi:endo-1,4-beta-mannosidase